MMLDLLMETGFFFVLFFFFIPAKPMFYAPKNVLSYQPWYSTLWGYDIHLQANIRDLRERTIIFGSIFLSTTKTQLVSLYSPETNLPCCLLNSQASAKGAVLDGCQV